MDWLRTTDDAGVASAVEEMLRRTIPAVHGLRTETRDTEIGGVPIAAGDPVTTWNPAADRDPSVFPDPDRFRPDRTPNKHLAFGVGQHFCIGARIGRMEPAALLTELRAHVKPSS